MATATSFQTGRRILMCSLPMHNRRSGRKWERRPLLFMCGSDATLGV